MTLEEKIGQLMCCGWSEPAANLNLNAQALRCVRDLHVGSFLLISRNVQPPYSKPLSVIGSKEHATIMDRLKSKGATT